MDQEDQREASRMQTKIDKYGIGKANKPGVAYNILSMDYHNNEQGESFKQQEEDRRARQQIRSNHFDRQMNSDYNILNGSSRSMVDVSQNNGRFNSLANAANDIIGAGRSSRINSGGGKKVYN